MNDDSNEGDVEVRFVVWGDSEDSEVVGGAPPTLYDTAEMAEP